MGWLGFQRPAGVHGWVVPGRGWWWSGDVGSRGCVWLGISLQLVGRAGVRAVTLSVLGVARGGCGWGGLVLGWLEFQRPAGVHVWVCPGRGWWCAGDAGSRVCVWFGVPVRLVGCAEVCAVTLSVSGVVREGCGSAGFVTGWVGSRRPAGLHGRVGPGQGWWRSGDVGSRGFVWFGVSVLPVGCAGVCAVTLSV